MDIAHSGEIQQEIQVLTMTLFALVTALIASGHLEDMAGDACEVCGDGLYSLKSKREEGKAEHVEWRCSEYDCQHRRSVIQDHPLFVKGVRR